MNPTFVSNSIKMLDDPGTGRVEEAITAHQRGWVAFEGTYWYAEQYRAEQTAVADQPIAPAAIAPGSWVQVIARRGNTLLVIRLTSDRTRYS